LTAQQQENVMFEIHSHKERREEFMRRMNKAKKGSIALIASSPVRTRNSDVDYPYRQDTDFFYLTGFNEPHAVAVFIPNHKGGKYILFCDEYDQEKEIWNGRNAGLDGAKEIFCADESFSITELPARLPDLIANRERVYHSIDGELYAKIMDARHELKQKVRAGTHLPYEFVAIENILHKMRMIKTSTELAHMRHAIDVSADAHIRAMRFCKPGMYEYEIEAEVIHEMTRKGLRNVAYPSIVGGGKNGCTLHYMDNCDVLRDGDLLLIDAGAESKKHCAADITRTFPINGKFTKPQALLYQLVHDAQLAAREQVRPGNRWNHPHEAAVRVLTKGLLDLGIIKGDFETLVLAKLENKGLVHKYFPHRTGHWLGLNVHDAGDYQDENGEWVQLEPGMTLTVEPGLYILPDDMSVNKKWRGIGIRIEDDILVTEDGHEVLSARVPKTITEIETLMRG
jgi:Xaa-Pro aminopeptidase